MASLTHLNQSGEAHMVDVGAKETSQREATAQGSVKMLPQTLDMVIEGNAKKGDVISVARIAGIMAAKKTPEIIPLCHPIALSKVTVDIEADPDLPGLRVRATAGVAGQTGVEMEALTAVSTAALTVYDMTKAVDKAMEIGGIRVTLKDGGKSGRYEAS